MNAEELKTVALDLTKEVPRSPRVVLGGYVVAARTLDKCRAVLNKTAGEYHFNCPLDQYFLDFAEIQADTFKEFVATGADDDAVGAWIEENAKKRQRIEIIKWNNKMRDTRISEMPEQLQEFLEEYIPKYIGTDRPVYHWFDVYDLEEGRI